MRRAITTLADSTRSPEIFAFVEVPDASPAFDLGRKQRLYASLAIPDYLVADLGRERLMHFTKPNDLAYGKTCE